MGRTSKKKQGQRRDTRTIELFDSPVVDDSIVCLESALQPITSPVWTENKARVIQRYLRYFIMVTHHGTYVDAFAGPQVEQFNDHSWAAKLALEIEPAWLRRFVLCELKPAQIAHLERLIGERRANGDTRSIDLVVGDCNVKLPEALRTQPIKPREAAFCLLDQRTFECEWATVQFLATHKTDGNKVELFYFLPVGWLHRSLSGLRDDDRLRRWWGRDDLSLLRGAHGVHEIARVFTDRFRQELHYKSVLAWPIFDRREGGRIMYFMIHAADHQEAPKLMNRAYRKATGTIEPMDHLQLELDSAAFDRAAMDA